MISRAFKLWLWGLPFRGTALRIWDRLPFIGAERVVPANVPAYPGSAGPYPIVRDEGTLTDEARGIGLRYSLFHPEELDDALPVVIFSVPPAWGRKYPAPESAYIVEHLAAHGYLVLRLWHPDSDKHILSRDMDEAEDRHAYIGSMREWAKGHHRYLDIPFVLDTFEAWNAGDGPLAGKIDLTRIGVSGFSYGAATTQALLGRKMGPESPSYKDDRVKAGIAYGTITDTPDIPAETFAETKGPLLYMAGSRDRTWSRATLPEDKTRAYHECPASKQYLLVLKGADHPTFGGKRIEDGVVGAREAYNHRLVQSAGLAFWDAYLKEDEAARHWLDEDFPRLLGRDGKLERK